MTNSNEQDLLDKLKSKGIPLGKYVNGKIYRGVLTGLNEAFVISKEKRDELIAKDPKSAELIRPFLIGKEIKRYSSLRPAHHIILIPKGWTNTKSKCIKDAWRWLQNEYPAIAFHLEPFKYLAEKRFDKGEYWWELRTCDYYTEFEKLKIIIPAITNSANYAFDSDGFYSNDKTSIIPTDDLYLLCLLNSTLLDFFLKSIASTKSGGFSEYKPMYISKIPIRAIDFSNPADKARHDRMVSLVGTMLALHKRLPEVNTPQEKDVIQRQIIATDAQIDRLVYQLYDLTGEEIKVVENV